MTRFKALRLTATLLVLCSAPAGARAEDFAVRARMEAAARLPAYPVPLPEAFPSPDMAAFAVSRRLVVLETRERGLRAIGRPTIHKLRQIGGWVGFGACLGTAVVLPFGVMALSRDDPDVTSQERRMERAAFAMSGVLAAGAGAFLWLALTTPSNPFKEEIVSIYLERRALRRWLGELSRKPVEISLGGAGVRLRF